VLGDDVDVVARVVEEPIDSVFGEAIEIGTTL
jgi:hypothetical protein